MSIDPRRYLPPLFDFERLFVELRPAEPDQNTASAGFPDGSRILISGEAGSGKTTFALAMVRALMMQWWPTRFGTPTFSSRFSPQRDEPVEHELCYLSTEVDVLRLKKLFRQYGWFRDGDPVFNLDRGAKGPTLVVPSITEAKVRLPLKGAGEVVDLVLKTVKDHYAQSRARDVFVVVDSLTAILKDSSDPGERRRDAQQFLNRLAEMLRPAEIALAFLIAERPAEPDSVTYADEVAADFVFRLGQAETSAGRWQRRFTVAKSAGVNMSIGNHTWAVLTSTGLGYVIGQQRVATAIAENALMEFNNVAVTGATAANVPENQEWGTVAVFPRPQLGPIGLSNQTDAKQAVLPKEYIWSGTYGLDELLTGNVEYWITREAKKTTGVQQGSTTLLVGTAGSGKTTICLQFLAADVDYAKSLYVNFESPASDIARGFDAKGASDGSLRTVLQSCETLYRRRGNLDLNLLLAELRYVIQKREIDRVVLDGLSDLLATTQRADYSRMLEAVLGTIREVRKETTTFITFEFDPGGDESHLPGVEGLSATAHNVVVLRRILVNDEFRRTAYVLKARGLNPDVQVREVQMIDGSLGSLRIWSGLESYSDLLSRHPKPLEVYLQLFSENAAQSRVNTWLVNRLNALFAHNVHMFGFSRSAIIRTINDAISTVGRIPHSDVKVVSLDEWWVREHGVRGERPSPTAEARVHPLLPLDPLFRSPSHAHDPGQTTQVHGNAGQYRPSPAQFWVFEIEKATVPVRRDTKEGTVDPASHLLAVPSYTDFSMFCVNRALFRDVSDAQGSADPSIDKRRRQDWLTMLANLPRAWAFADDAAPFGFRKPNPSSREVLADWMASARDKGHRGFSFDLETSDTGVCVFLELCWAFGAPEDFLISSVVDFGRAKRESREDAFLRNSPLTRALRLLQYLVYYDLMDAWPTLRHSHRSLFTRQWYSTVSDLIDTSDKREGIGLDTDLAPFPLPFFPVGAAGTSTTHDGIREACQDAYVRFERLVRRVLAALCYRCKDNDESEISSVLQILEAVRTLTTFNNTPNDVGAFATELGRLGERLRDVALAAPELARGRVAAETPSPLFQRYAQDVIALLPAAKVMNLRDVLELLDWHDFRLKLLRAQAERERLADVIAREFDESLPRDPRASNVGVSALTGYASSGSWFVGVGRRTHNPLLSWKLMEELTSFDAAVRRSQEGAGLPVRKDFYDVLGREPVEHVEHLTWSKLLKFGGARARRRDRTLCPGISATSIFDVIYCQLLQGLTMAQALRGSPWDSLLSQSSTRATTEILSAVSTAMKTMAAERDYQSATTAGTCASCSTRTLCASLWA